MSPGSHIKNVACTKIANMLAVVGILVKDSGWSPMKNMSSACWLCRWAMKPMHGTERWPSSSEAVSSTDWSHSSTRRTSLVSGCSSHCHGNSVSSGKAASDSRTAFRTPMASPSYASACAISTSRSGRSDGSGASRRHSWLASRAERIGNCVFSQSSCPISCWPASTAHIIRSSQIPPRLQVDRVARHRRHEHLLGVQPALGLDLAPAQPPRKAFHHAQVPRERCSCIGHFWGGRSRRVADRTQHEEEGALFRPVDERAVG
eukprot:3257286-Prymnesium_polylepis.1